MTADNLHDAAQWACITLIGWALMRLAQALRAFADYISERDGK